MILRVVKMRFRPEETESFLSYFDGRKERIRSFAGCRHLELWRSPQDLNLFFTYSHWDSEAQLEAYRRSEFFDETWRATKAKFAERAEAWTVEPAVVLP
ncbi:MAG: antibiotic biosynthesis monooxygenase [Chitinophagaceae bacterium]|nr:MAG: antibiotic biosynthesis monooxygenase [Chitinophagaceae bacterium]